MAGIKLSNEYQRAFGRLYAKTPKSVFAAIALSLSYRDVEEESFPEAVRHFVKEWRCLQENGIVQQRVPGDALAELPKLKPLPRLQGE